VTKEEALGVAKILVQADDRCETCAGKLCDLFLQWKPEFEEEVKKAWKEEFDEEWTK